MKKNKIKLSDLNENSTIKDFIKFYQQIPAKKWCTIVLIGFDGKKKCARGHLGTMFNNEETPQDIRLTSLAPNLVNVNNMYTLDFPQKSPKARVIAYLKSLL